MASPEGRTAHIWGSEVSTSANLNKQPRGWLALAYNSAAQTISTTGSPVALTSCTVDVACEAGRLYRIEAQGEVTAGVGTTHWIGEIRKNGTAIGRWGHQSQAPAVSVIRSNGFAYFLSSTTATVTFDMAINTDVVAIVNGGGATVFASIMVEDCGSLT